jgi:hypothetical protein
MSARFKYGDKVKIRSHEAKVISARKTASGGYIYTVRFDDPNLIPPEMDYAENQLYNRGSDSHCPACNTEWTVVKFNMKVWKDCKKCNKTSEQIIKECSEQKSNLSSKSKQDLLKDFERMLDGVKEEDYKYSDVGIWYDDDLD